MKNKKVFVIVGLLAVSAVLIAALAAMSQPEKQPDTLMVSPSPDVSVTPNEIASIPTVTPAPEVKPSAIPTPAPTPESNPNDIPLTVIEDKPEPPELPDTAYTGEPTGEATQEDIDAYEALDPALKNPDVKPSAAPAPVEPSKPKDTTPQSGDKDGNGNVYIPGFGWIKDEGGGGHGEQSQLDPEHSDFDKIIGH